MFRDNSLVPAEAIRLAALGLLAEAPRRYGDLAIEIRYFTSRVAGPSLDLMGSSLELLRYQGLIEAVDGKGMADNAMLRLTASGRASLEALLQAHLRAPLGDYNRLAMLLKLRFLHQLPTDMQRGELLHIAELLESELARLEELRAHNASAPLPFLDWLELDIEALRARLKWVASRLATEHAST